MDATCGIWQVAITTNVNKQYRKDKKLRESPTLFGKVKERKVRFFRRMRFCVPNISV